MPIPRGHHIGRGGWLEKDSDSKKKNGHSNGNGNGNGVDHSNGSGNGGSNGNGNGSNGGGMSESKTLTQFLEDVKIEHIDGSSTTVVDIIKPQPMISPKNNIQYTIPEKTTYVSKKTGKIIHVYLAWTAKN